MCAGQSFQGVNCIIEACNYSRSGFTGLSKLHSGFHLWQHTSGSKMSLAYVLLCLLCGKAIQIFLVGLVPVYCDLFDLCENQESIFLLMFFLWSAPYFFSSFSLMARSSKYLISSGVKSSSCKKCLPLNVPSSIINLHVQEYTNINVCFLETKRACRLAQYIQECMYWAKQNDLYYVIIFRISSTNFSTCVSSISSMLSTA